MLPQVAPWASHVVGVQPQWFGIPPPPHGVSGGQTPQSMTFAHPSLTFPHTAESFSQVCGVQLWPSSEQAVGPIPTHTEILS